MIRADQIPDEAADAAYHAYYAEKPCGFRESLAAALNAWPGACHYGDGFMPPLPCNSVVLPLPQKKGAA